MEGGGGVIPAGAIFDAPTTAKFRCWGGECCNGIRAHTSRRPRIGVPPCSTHARLGGRRGQHTAKPLSQAALHTHELGVTPAWPCSAIEAGPFTMLRLEVTSTSSVHLQPLPKHASAGTRACVRAGRCKLALSRFTTISTRMHPALNGTP